MIDDLWYKNAIVYCLDVKTFMDSNGDGVGDFEGLTRRLPYLAGLGVEAIWLLPFNASPRRDNGYDITDYYCGRSAARHARRLRRLLARGEEARHPDPDGPGGEPHVRPAPVVQVARWRTSDSPYRDWYVWSKKKPTVRGDGDGLPGRAEDDLELPPEGARLLLPPLLQVPARPQHVEPGGPRGDPADRGLLAPARRLRLPGRRGAVRDPEGGGDRPAHRAVRRCSATSATSSSGARATRSCSPRRTCSRSTTSTTSAARATGCT